MTSIPIPPDAGESAAIHADDAPVATGGAFGVKGLGWGIFEWARNPYYNLIVISVFTPYFAAEVINNGAQGQALVARTITIAGLIMAFVAPILGAVVDKAGRKKPFLFVVLMILSLLTIGLWQIAPGKPGVILLGMSMLAIGYCLYTVSELLHNSMLPGAGRPSAVPMISGLGLALGNGAGMVLLVAVFYLIGNPPAFLADAAGGVRRFTGPIAGVWLIIFVIPFFLMMPDVYRKGQTWRKALGDLFKLAPAERAVTGIWPVGFFAVKPFLSLRSKFKEHPNVMKYLVARMIWADGLGALLTIGGVYAASALNLSGGEVVLLGIIGGLFAVIGGFVGGRLDQVFGPKKALTIELIAITIILILQISITPQSLFFGLIPAGAPVLEGDVLNTLPKLVYAGLIIPSAIALVACISSSRYMLIHIAPPAKIGEFFGFYAMVGSVTLWLGPGLIDLVTSTTGDVRLGMGSVIILFAIGLILLQTVKSDKTPEYLKTTTPAPQE